MSLPLFYRDAVLRLFPEAVSIDRWLRALVLALEELPAPGLRDVYPILLFYFGSHTFVAIPISKMFNGSLAEECDISSVMRSDVTSHVIRCLREISPARSGMIVSCLGSFSRSVLWEGKS